MSHTVDQVIDAVVALLQQGVTSIDGSNVLPHRSLSLSDQSGELPALTVNFGKDEPNIEFAGADGDSLIDSIVELRITAHVRGDQESIVKRTLLAVRGEVQSAMLRDPNLGLDCVVYTNYGGADEPDFDSSSDAIVGRLPILFLVHYRMSAANPS